MRLVYLLFIALFSLAWALPPLKQATRSQIVDRVASRPQRRQAQASAGIYPLCQGSNARGTGQQNAVSDGIKVDPVSDSLSCHHRGLGTDDVE